MDRLTFTIGTPTSGVSMAIRRRSGDEAADYWDGNWLSATATFSLGLFQGSIPGSIRAEELVPFHEQLGQLYQSLCGTAEFSTMEGWFGIKLTGDSRGHVHCGGFIMDRAGDGNRLNFSFEIDQSYLPPMLAGLEQARAAFPVVGRP
jgi:hypothetical protein